MNYRRSQAPGICAVAMAVVVLFAGCTPEEEQALRNGVNTAAQDAANQAIGFALDFGRQALAALLV